MKVAHIVGCRPQFIKVCMVDRELRNIGHESIILHTGQHYDGEMSQVFFDRLGIPTPKINLGIGSGSHAFQTGKAMIGIEQFLLEEKPDWTLVYGDTNATLAGALAACKSQIKLAHVEAGLRSFNRKMPEEYNRIITDHCSELLFCPTLTARSNLKQEGITSGAYFIGDVMLDATNYFLDRQSTRILDKLEIFSKNYLLVTVHRSEVSPSDLSNIIAALEMLNETVVFPAHPRTAPLLSALFVYDKVKLISPVDYFDMLALESNAKMILTDSGGVQREAYFLGVPCLTLRKETEWIETVETGWNFVVGADPESIIWHAKNFQLPTSRPAIFGDGNAAKHTVKCLENNYNEKL